MQASLTRASAGSETRDTTIGGIFKTGNDKSWNHFFTDRASKKVSRLFARKRRRLGWLVKATKRRQQYLLCVSAPYEHRAGEWGRFWPILIVVKLIAHVIARIGTSFTSIWKILENSFWRSAVSFLLSDACKAARRKISSDTSEQNADYSTND